MTTSLAATPALSRGSDETAKLLRELLGRAESGTISGAVVITVGVVDDATLQSRGYAVGMSRTESSALLKGTLQAVMQLVE